MARARVRAELYARAAGLRVERMVSIAEDGAEAAPVQPPRPFTMRALSLAAAAPSQILPGDTDVTATVSVRFVLR